MGVALPLELAAAGELHDVALRVGPRYDVLMTVEAKRVPPPSGAPTDGWDDGLELLEENVDEGTPEEIEAAWMAEVKRRIADVKRGKAILISSETARRMRVEILERARARRTG